MVLVCHVRKQALDRYRSNPLPPAVTNGCKILKSKLVNTVMKRMLVELERLMCYMQDGHSYILPVTKI